MNTRRICLNATAVVVFTLALASLAEAQAPRTFVASRGSDTNPCTHIQPCRTLQGAFKAVQTGGEIVALDSDDYGPVAIDRSVTITGEGVHAAVQATGTNTSAITVNGDGITVNLRHLHIQTLAQKQGHGIAAQNFAALHVESCTVSGFYNGISVSESSSARSVFVADTILRNGNYGIHLRNSETATNTTVATVERTRTLNNVSYGVYLFGKVNVTARASVASGGYYGFYVTNKARLSVEESVASNNSVGINVALGATVRVSNSTVTDNTAYGFNNQGAVFESRQNNTVRGNLTDAAGTITPFTGN